MSPSSANALSRCLANLIPTTFRILMPAPCFTHTSPTQLRLGYNNSTSQFSPSFNRGTASTHTNNTSGAHSTPIPWTSVWTRISHPHLRPLHLPWHPTARHRHDIAHSSHKYPPPLPFHLLPHSRVPPLCTPIPPSPAVGQNFDYAHLLMMPAIVGGRTRTRMLIVCPYPLRNPVPFGLILLVCRVSG